MFPSVESAARSLFDALVAADPGYTRLRFAGRATISVAITLGLLIGLSHLLGTPFFSFLIGVVISMISSVAVNDPEPRQQRITGLLIPVPAMISMTLGGLLSFSAYLAEAVFVLVMFGAVYVRRFGPRWFAFGMIAFISYFFSMFLRAKPEQLPWMYLAALLGAGISFVMRVWIMPVPAHPPVADLLPALRARVRMILASLRLTIGDPARRERHYRRARRHLAQMNELALVFSAHPEEAGWDYALFQAELTARHLTELGRYEPPEPDRDAVKHDLETVERALWNGELSPPAAIEWRTEPASTYGKLLRSLVESLSQCSQGCTDPEMDRQSEDEEKEQVDDGVDSGEEQKTGLRPITRRAVQVAVASVIAIAGGQILSSKRWYWAAITAFIVFTGTNSRGDVFVKGWQRVLGTLVGVFAGVLLATAVAGNQVVSFALIFVSIFCGFYLVRISYALMIFWITILLALLYGLLGLFSIEILALRLEETIIGAAAGTLVALFLLPTRTSSVLAEQSREFLRNLAVVIGDARGRMSGERPGRPVLPRIRELDRSYQSARRTAGPLMLRFPGVSEPRSSQHWLRVLLGLRHEAHNLARLGRRSDRVDSSLSSDWISVAVELEKRVEALADVVAKESPSRETLELVQRADTGNTRAMYGDPLNAAERCLRRIDWIVTILAMDVGVAKEPVVTENEAAIP